MALLGHLTLYQRIVPLQRCCLNILMRVFIDMYHQLTYAVPVQYWAQATYMYERCNYQRSDAHRAPAGCHT